MRFDTFLFFKGFGQWGSLAIVEQMLHFCDSSTFVCAMNQPIFGFDATVLFVQCRTYEAGT